jgi:hypothetical protein
MIAMTTFSFGEAAARDVRYVARETVAAAVPARKFLRLS